MKKDIRYVATPTGVVEAMLALAEVGPQDLVFDLGCGDGRLVVAAARRGARAVGIDIDPGLISRSEENARRANQQERTEFRRENLFHTDLSDATVVLLYLLHSVNRRLLPKLRRELRPGTRLISHSFDMGDWLADRQITVESKWVYRWTL
ncbi:MAG: methyltransferase domain-containing protein [Vulcanimicrobiota bacterium]